MLSPLPPDAVVIILREAFGAAGHVAALVPSYADYCLGALASDRMSKLTISLPPCRRAKPAYQGLMSMNATRVG